MKMRVVGFSVLLLSATLNGTATAQGRGGTGGAAGIADMGAHFKITRRPYR